MTSAAPDLSPTRSATAEVVDTIKTVAYALLIALVLRVILF